MLSVRNVSVERGYRRLLCDLSFSIGAGQLWQIAGENGIGKTSLLRVLAGLVAIGVEGEINREVPMLYQGHGIALKPLLSAEENLRYHPSGTGSRDSESVDYALVAVGLAGYDRLPVNQLSAGQQRRVALARLWLSKEPLWLLDEPFTAIDVHGAALLEKKMLAHVAEGGSVIFTSHQPSGFGTDVRVLDLTHYAA